MKRNVLLVSPSAAQGGAERGLLYLAERLPAYGFDPTCVLLENGPLEEWLAEADCRVKVMPAGRARQAVRLGRTVLDLAKEMERTGAVISNQSKGHIYGGPAAKLASIPEVWWQQQHPSLNRIDVAAALLPSSVVVCSSEASVRAQRRLTPRRRIEMIHLGTPVEKIGTWRGSGTNVRRDHGWLPFPVVGIVGRLQAWKGQDVFLRAAASVSRRFPEARFVVVGGAILGWEGSYPGDLKRLSEQLGIASRTHFAGHQPNVYPWFDSLDIVVHASYGEPFDHVLIEAMALGKPLIATSKGGTAQIVEEGVSGILVPPGDETRMAQAIIHLLENPRLARRIGNEARRRVAKFSAGAMTERFAEILDQLMNLHSPSGTRSPHMKCNLESIPDKSTLNEPMSVPNSNAMAASGTHDTCETLLDPPDSGLVLDVGAGQGAFSWRLHRLGYRVLALGILPHQFKVQKEVPYFRCDLELGIPVSQGTVSGIVAIEVIEHLEAPFRLLREAARCLRIGGFLILTTPNVLSISSKLSFLFRNHMIHFGEQDFVSNGHVSPLSLQEITWMAKATGLTVETVTYNVGKLPIPKIRHKLPLTARIFRTTLFGEILIIKLRKRSTERINRARG